MSTQRPDSTREQCLRTVNFREQVHLRHGSSEISVKLHYTVSESCILRDIYHSTFHFRSPASAVPLGSTQAPGLAVTDWLDKQPSGFSSHQLNTMTYKTWSHQMSENRVLIQTRSEVPNLHSLAARYALSIFTCPQPLIELPASTECEHELRDGGPCASF